MDAKLYALALLVASAASRPLSAEEYSVWDSDGSGNWSDATRWKDGKLPSETKNVWIESADAYVTDADYGIFTGLARVRFKGKASLDMRFDEDHASFCVNTIMNATSGDTESTLIKSGRGTLVHSGHGNGFAVDRFIVTNGTLRLDVLGKTVLSTNIVFGSYAPGRLIFNAHSSDQPYQKTVDIKGLAGDGAVTNAVTPATIRIYGDASSRFDFSGTIEGATDISLVGTCACQDFTGNDAESTRTIRLFGGTLGVKHFGTKGVSGTLGPGETLCWFRGNSEVLYLGDGETSDKFLKLNTDCTMAAIDAGCGGLRLTGEWTFNGVPGSVPVYLRGTNQTTAVFSGTIKGNSTNVAEIVKQGSGTWRLARNIDGMIGTISVEDGTLEYTSVSNKGEACSLGNGTRLFEPTSGVIADLQPVPWAIRLGSHSTTGVFAYVGADDVSCTSRLFAVNGTGIVRSDTAAALHYVGATSYGSQGGNLVLDGSGLYDNFSDVTNGVGVLVVEKKGAGTWTLGGDVDVGGVSVRDGVLHIANANAYGWFRFTVKKLWGDAEQNLQLSQFGLYDESGNQVNLDLVRLDMAKARAFTLSPGGVAWNHDYVPYVATRDVEQLFKGSDGLMTVGKGAVCPSPSDSSTWISFTMRLADNVGIVRYYDVKSQQGYIKSKEQMYEREPREWMLEGSVDGRNWVVLDEQSFTSAPIGTGALWYSCNKSSHDAAHMGYSIGEPLAHRTAIDSVFVAEGATLEADMTIDVDKIAIDTVGGGTLKNFAFAQYGTVEMAENPESGVFVPMTFVGVDGIENIKNWNVSVRGVVSDRLRAHGRSGGIQISHNGLIVTIR